MSASEAQLWSRRPDALGLPKSSPPWSGVRIISGYCLNLHFLVFNGYRFVGAIFRESGWHDRSAPGAVARDEWELQNGGSQSSGAAAAAAEPLPGGLVKAWIVGPFSAFPTLVFKEAEEPEIKLPTFTGSWRKQGISRKTSTSASLTTWKPLTTRITINWKIL